MSLCTCGFSEHVGAKVSFFFQADRNWNVLIFKYWEHPVCVDVVIVSENKIINTGEWTGGLLYIPCNHSVLCMIINRMTHNWDTCGHINILIIHFIHDTCISQKCVSVEHNAAFKNRIIKWHANLWMWFQTPVLILYEYVTQRTWVNVKSIIMLKSVWKYVFF